MIILCIAISVLILVVAMFLYGFVKIVMTNTLLYYKIYVYAIGTLILGTIFDFLYYFIAIPDSPLFTVSLLSTFGCFLFFLSANYGIMNKTIDDGSKKYKKLSHIAFIAPLFYILLLLAILLLGSNFVEKVPYIISVLPIFPASYFSFKLLLFPSDIKKIHIFSLSFYFFYIIFLFAYENDILYIISNIGIAISLIGILHEAKRGSNI